ncbi:hypothetical protein DVH24_030200 [Malus domestica]|uniref:Uncharacterized protein n=1 Tax=Malus domestica TaxID=3750 RepID=A0A498HXX7_MALDO|nr:hypothetical protein DVH24_030200 [Malus domestica]
MIDVDAISWNINWINSFFGTEDIASSSTLTLRVLIKLPEIFMPLAHFLFQRIFPLFGNMSTSSSICLCDWMICMVANWYQGKFDFLMMHLGDIWQARNALLWEGKSSDPFHVA